MIIELLTATLVLITGFYAWITFRILRANEKVVDVMREQTLAISRPYVVVVTFLELDNPIFYIRVTNSGKTAATNLRLTIDKSFQQFGDLGKEHDLSTFVAFNQTINSFSPGAEIIFALAQGAKVFSQGEDLSKQLPPTFSITAEYDFAGQRVTEINRINKIKYPTPPTTPPVIPPFLKRPESRGYAAKANFCFGVMPPRAMLGRS